MSKPTIILVHGSWHRPDHYRPFLDILERKGYPCVAPTLPSGNTPPPENPTQADVHCIREAARNVVEQGREVIAVAHSYGGVVATEAFAGLGVRNRAAEGRRGGVRWLVYVTAFMLSGNDCMGDVLTPQDAMWLGVEGTEAVFAKEYDQGSFFYSDIPKEHRAKWQSLLRSCPISVAAYVPREMAYRDIDTVYVYCENDLAVPLTVQKALVRKVKELGIRIKEESLQAGHFPSLSMPAELAEVVEHLSDHRSRL